MPRMTPSVRRMNLFLVTGKANTTYDSYKRQTQPQQK